MTTIIKGGFYMTTDQKIEQIKKITDEMLYKAGTSKYKDNRWNVLNKEPIGFLSLLTADDEEVLIPDFNDPQLALCGKRGKAYCTDQAIADFALECFPDGGLEYIVSDEPYKPDKNEKYDCIILPTEHFPYADTEYCDMLYGYLVSAEDILKDGGKFIIYVSQKNLNDLYNTIAEENRKLSLNAVLKTNYRYTVIFEKKAPSKEVYIRDIPPWCEDFDLTYDKYLKREDGFMVPRSELMVLDPKYYDPKNREVVELLKRNDARRLGDIADITFSGFINYKSPMSDTSGYFPISPLNIKNGEVSLPFGEEKPYIETDYVEEHLKRSIIKKGDLLVSLRGNWGIYNTDEKAVVIQAFIIREKKATKGLFKTLSDDPFVIDYFSAQLEFFRNGHYFLHTKDIESIVIPDDELLESMRELENTADTKDRLKLITRELCRKGWTVRTSNDKNIPYDLELKGKNGRTHAVMVTGDENGETWQQNSLLTAKLKDCQRRQPDAAVYYLAGSGSFKYENSKLTAIGEDFYRDLNPLTAETDIILKAINAGFAKTSQKLDTVGEKLDTANEKLDDIKEMLIQQTGMLKTIHSSMLEGIDADDESAEEFTGKVASTAADEYCKFIDGALTQQPEDILKAKEEELEDLLGDQWDRLEENSKTLLKTDLAGFDYYQAFENKVDYSGICLMTVKTLEIELSKRLYMYFIEYFKTKYNLSNKAFKNYHIQDNTDCPPAFMNENEKFKGEKNITIGNFPYLFGYKSIVKDTEDNHKNELKKVSTKYLKALKALKEKYILSDKEEKILSDKEKSLPELELPELKDFRNELQIVLSDLLEKNDLSEVKTILSEEKTILSEEKTILSEEEIKLLLELNRNLKSMEEFYKHTLKEKVFNDYRKTLMGFGDELDDVTKEYRNPAAHTGLIEHDKAEACINFVVKSSRLLRRILEIFNTDFDKLDEAGRINKWKKLLSKNNETEGE